MGKPCNLEVKTSVSEMVRVSSKPEYIMLLSAVSRGTKWYMQPVASVYVRALVKNEKVLAYTPC
jgi:hypothetical protein